MTRTYGRWAVIAGASEGLGAAFADALASNGHDLVLIARREDVLEHVASGIRTRHGVEVRCEVLDLGSPDLADALRPLLELELGVVVYNAAYAPVGPFLQQPLENLLRVIDVNVRGPLTVAHALGSAMHTRGQGALVLVSSLAGLQGTARLATYAGTKAFNVVLAEALWHELKPLDVVVCCAGAVRTPGYAAAASAEAPGTLDAAAVVAETLAGLGHGPRVTPGRVNRLATWFMSLLGRRQAIGLMARNTENLS